MAFIASANYLALLKHKQNYLRALPSTSALDAAAPRVLLFEAFVSAAVPAKDSRDSYHLDQLFLGRQARLVMRVFLVAGLTPARPGPPVTY